MTNALTIIDNFFEQHESLGSSRFLTTSRKRQSLTVTNTSTSRLLKTLVSVTG